ncbi:di-trans,poly-cis-decaprenylcistransferase [Candidatus Roizmanbacteria bacterium CG_4_10_14_0_8_um_filter_39_9]|uniref:Isoprenyl transferase n=1 Tax=Candidatus Roizmanbacteria bacterium CG_4_10_14_0_8_um_filter_39_9 TaxID=1974829 RepID=A0A2M7QCP8_9BACT|nr:MAG: di-trans,poly-cis-decaprenylcistransferase [Candidatus Roizmanbacteria bacterium CG_4_10_14_0_8_um_filter_39_9]
MDKSHIPTHIAIIADGNRRWAKEKGLPTLEGHRRGAETVKALSKRAKVLGVKIITFWVFSTENWKRTVEETGYLMNLFDTFIDREREEAIKEKTRIIHMGRKDRIPDGLKKKIIQAEEETKHFTDYYFVVALDYGGRDEIIRGIKKLTDFGLRIDDLDKKSFNNYLDTKDLPQAEPDLIIRTSGEERLSGFMTWQSAYSEYYFSPLMFPDFGPDELEKAIDEYGERKRRFGK